MNRGALGACGTRPERTGPYGLGTVPEGVVAPATRGMSCHLLLAPSPKAGARACGLGVAFAEYIEGRGHCAPWPSRVTTTGTSTAFLAKSPMAAEACRGVWRRGEPPLSQSTRDEEGGSLPMRAVGRDVGLVMNSGRQSPNLTTPPFYSYESRKSVTTAVGLTFRLTICSFSCYKGPLPLCSAKRTNT